MKHKFSFFNRCMVMLVAMVTIGVGSVWGGTATVSTGTYVKQSSPSITGNGSYILMFTGNYILCNTNASSTDYVTQYSYGSAPNSITITNDNREFVWVVQNYNTTFKLVGPNGEAYSNSNKTMSVVSSGSSWQMDGDYIKTGSLYIKYVSSNGFRCYNTSGNRTKLVAVYKLQASGYDITYECNGATSGCPEKATGQTKLPDQLPTGVVKTGYNFDKWCTDEGLTTEAEGGTTISANTTLYAKWTAKEYYVTLDKNEHAAEDGLFSVTYNTAIASEDFAGVTASTGWVLTGYFTSTSGGTKVVNANGTLVNNVSGWTTSDGKWAKDADDVTLYAQYEPTCTSEITITKGAETNGAYTISPVGTVCIDGGNATVGVTNIIPAEHYHFGEITTSVSGSVDNENKQVTNISESTTIAVVFAPDPTYTITFVDGVHNTTCTSFNMTDVYAGTQIVFNSIADKTPASPTGDCMADHYHFVGWVESGVEPKENPSNVIAAGTTSINVTKTVTYKAVWAQEKTE